MSLVLTNYLFTALFLPVVIQPDVLHFRGATSLQTVLGTYSALFTKNLVLFKCIDRDILFNKISCEVKI